MKDCLADVLFSDPFRTKRSDHESQESGLRFDLKNPLGGWILSIHDPFWILVKNAKSVFGFKNQDSDFPKKAHLY